MKISDEVLLAILLATFIVSVTIVLMTAILTDGSQGDKYPVDTRIIRHITHENGYQLVDSVNQRICVIYPDASEPGDRLDCWSVE